MKRAPLAILILTLATCAAFPQQATPAAPVRTVAERLGYPANSRLLVIHADDFGVMHSVNRAIITAFQNRWITSASILVPCPWFPEVAKFARENPQDDVGIHLALNSEWTPMRWGPIAPKTEVPSLLDSDGYLPLVETQVVKQARPAEVEIELRAQITKAQQAGIKLSHLDTHMGTVIRTPEMFATYLRLGQAFHLPTLLEQQPDFQGIALNPAAILTDRVLQISPGVPPEQWLDAYKKMLAPLPPGSYQLIVHLGYNDEELRGATYDHPDWGAAWRQHDLDMVSSPAFQQFLREQGFILVSWRDLAKALQ
jgi:chitin disaccharide deacetylase